jgi:hypothetical protein
MTQSTIADFTITRYQTSLSSPYKNICQQKIPEAIVFIKLSGGSILCDSNPSQLQNTLDVTVSSPCGLVESDLTKPIHNAYVAPQKHVHPELMNVTGWSW